MIRPGTVTLVIALAACVSTPDLERGRAAAERRDWRAAERDLAPLARAGYPDAQVELARLYARDETSESQAQAIDWMRRAQARQPGLTPELASLLMDSPAPTDHREAAKLLRQARAAGEPRALPLTIRLYRKHPRLDPDETVIEFLQLAMRRGAQEDLRESIRWLRSQVAIGDNRQILTELCRQAVAWEPGCLRDLVRQARLQGEDAELRALSEAGLVRHRRGTVDEAFLLRLAEALVDELPQPAAPAPQAARMLSEAVRADTPRLRGRLAHLLVDHPSIRDPRAPRELLKDASGPEADRAALALGRRLMRGEGLAPDPDAAESLLRRAAQSLPAAHFSLGELFERGYGRRPDPRQALNHYLTAARTGYRRADLALAELYLDAAGVVADPENAYVFARIARHHGLTGSAALLERAEAGLPQPQWDAAERRAHAEFDWRQAAARRGELSNLLSDAAGARP